ncbi:MAG: tRNA pseudouridine(55) synthase TruB, partial [Dongiaceae bacterium]
GAVLETSTVRPDDDAIRAVLPCFIGLVDQVPPAFSAIKVDGERAYDLAREGEVVEMASRKVRIDDLLLVERPGADEAVFLAQCGKGTYMRSLARDIAQHLGSVGHVSALRRLSVGPFHESRAISLETLQTMGHSPAAFEHLLPVETALDDIPALALTTTEASRLRSGQAVGLLHRQDRDRIRDFAPGCMVCAMSAGKLVALTRFDSGELVPVRVMNL